MNLFRKARGRTASFDMPKFGVTKQKSTSRCSPPSVVEGREESSEGASSEGNEGSYCAGASGLGHDPELLGVASLDLSSGGEMSPPPSATSLSVPSNPRIRSSSFDTSSLPRDDEDDCTLQVPNTGKRSASFDAAYNADDSPERESISTSAFLGLQKYYYRRKSNLEIPKLCIHCVHLESLAVSSSDTSPGSVTSSQFDYDNVSFSGCSISSESEWDSDDVESPIVLGRPRGITLSVTPSDSDDAIKPFDPSLLQIGDGESVVTLQVPILKPRSSSLDASYLQVTGHNDDRRASLDPDFLDVPVQPRSSSVDVNLPTDETSRYKAIQHAGIRKAISKSCQEPSELLHPKHAEIGYKKKELKSAVDWTENAVNGDHIWVDTNASSDFCYVGEMECSVSRAKTSHRKKCAACKIVVHTGCMSQLERINFKCKPTFREAGPRNYREQTFMRHHWVHRRREEGKCKQCGKSFQQRFSFQAKEIIAISCSWCKAAYHNKISCFMMQQIEEQCTLGIHAGIIIPPSWIIKMPRKGSFKSSIRKKKKASLKKRKSRDDHKLFIIKPIPSPHMKPLLVFINPKSGGNQGGKLISKFQWLLNPRQVFDLSQGGPRMGLELFKKVPNLRILACGGDGTAGWILSTIDSLGIMPPPPVAVLPLGTGNDLARTLNWGGGYTDEPISKILCSIEDGPVVQLDRYNLKVYPNVSLMEAERSQEEMSVPTLPLDVFQNYFSIGADAAVAIEFHEHREANPEKFNSRFRNKMFYAGAGGKDLLKRSWKDLADHITVVCDDTDITPKIKEMKLHCLLFLNIPKYSAGTSPWGNPSMSASGFEPQRHDDGYLEVIGLTTGSLAALHVGGHGERIVQCQTVSLTTYKTIPMQVDGEPCRLLPSKITISLRNQANMVQKPKRRGSVPTGNEPPAVPERLRIQVSCISMADYEALHYEKDKLREASVPIGMIVVENDADLEQVRQNINRLHEGTVKTCGRSAPQLSQNWCFVDSTTAERFFRIDRAQEHLHYVTDISSEDLYIMDPELNTSFLPRDGQLHPGSQPISATHLTVGPSEINGHHRLAPPTAVIVQDTEVNGTVDSSNNYHFSLPVTPPRTPGSDPGTPNSPRLQVKQFHVSPSTPALSTTKPALQPADKMFIDAAKRGDLNKLAEMHRNGASLTTTDQYGMTALHHAARFGHKDICKYLLEEAPREIIDMVDHEKGQTALHKAAWYQRRTICCLLIGAGASLIITDSQGNTPRLQALKAEDKDLAAYLESQEQFQLVVSEDQETAV